MNIHKNNRLRILCYTTDITWQVLSLSDNVMKLELSLNQLFFFSTYSYLVFMIKEKNSVSQIVKHGRVPILKDPLR